MGRATHVERFHGAEDKGIACTLLFTHQLQLLVVQGGTVLERLDDLGILAQQHLHQPHAVLGRLAVALLAGEDDHIAVISLVHHELQRDAVGQAAVEQEASAHLHGLGHHRHRCRSPDPLKEVVVDVFQPLIDAFTGVHVEADRIALHGRVLKDVVVKHVVVGGHQLVSEISIIVVAGLQQRHDAAVALVAGKAHVVAQGTAPLARLVVAAECDACRNAHHAVEIDAILHEHVKDAAGVHAAHATSLEHDTSLSCCHFPFIVLVFTAKIMNNSDMANSARRSDILGSYCRVNKFFGFFLA